MNDRPKEILPAGEVRYNAATSGQNGAVDKVYIKDSPYDKIDIKEHGGHTYDDEF